MQCNVFVHLKLLPCSERSVLSPPLTPLGIRDQEFNREYPRETNGEHMEESMRILNANPWENPLRAPRGSPRTPQFPKMTVCCDQTIITNGFRSGQCSFPNTQGHPRAFLDRFWNFKLFNKNCNHRPPKGARANVSRPHLDIRQSKQSRSVDVQTQSIRT